MDNISVGNLFPSNGSNYKPLDVHSLYNTKETKLKREEEFSVINLIKERKDKQQKVYDQYRKIYRMCLNKIKAANKMNKYEILYEVPDAIFRCPDYMSVECLDYLEIKLKKLKFDVKVVSFNTIYINWENLEKNRED